MEAVALKNKWQDIKKEELLLRQRKENLKLETELVKAKEEERVYFCCEEQTPSIPLNQLLVSTPCETKDEKKSRHVSTRNSFH